MSEPPAPEESAPNAAAAGSSAGRAVADPPGPGLSHRDELVPVATTRAHAPRAADRANPRREDANQGGRMTTSKGRRDLARVTSLPGGGDVRLARRLREGPDARVAREHLAVRLIHTTSAPWDRRPREDRAA